jgi:hypothetical protein
MQHFGNDIHFLYNQQQLSVVYLLLVITLESVYLIKQLSSLYLTVMEKIKFFWIEVNIIDQIMFGVE